MYKDDAVFCANLSWTSWHCELLLLFPILMDFQKMVVQHPSNVQTERKFILLATDATKATNMENIYIRPFVKNLLATNDQQIRLILSSPVLALTQYLSH